MWMVLTLFGVAIVLGMTRLFIGPRTPDRIFAADTLGVITMAGLVVLALILDSALYLDIALAYGVLSFVGVVALARIIETGKPS
jgi:multicomponent Na+:H+ antiporter subunit F